MENVTTSLQAPRHMQLLAHCLAAKRNMKDTRHIGFVDSTAVFVHSPKDELIALIPSAGIVQPCQGLLSRRALRGTRKASKLWAKPTHRP